MPRHQPESIEKKRAATSRSKKVEVVRRVSPCRQEPEELELAEGTARATLELQQTVGNAYVRRLAEEGRPIDPDVRSEMESVFGQDLKKVKVDKSDRATAASGYKAITTGETIHFAPGKYAPETREGREVLGHEIAHVVQQASSGPIKSREALEAEAANAGYEIAAGLQADVRLAAPQGLQGAPATGTVAEPLTPASVIKAGDPDGVFKLSEEQVRAASQQERLSLTRLVLKKSWVGPFDEYKIEMIWRTFERPELEQLLEKKENLDLWNECVKHGAELDKLPASNTVKLSFKNDVKAVADHYLETNRLYAFEELKRFGIITVEASPVPKTEQAARLASIKKVAQQLWAVEQAQHALAGLPVGWEYRTERRGSFATEGKYTVYFNPTKKPDRPADDRPDWPTWEATKGQYDQLSQVVADYCTRYPTVYGLYRDKRISELANATDAAAAQHIVAETLGKLLLNIYKTKLMLAADKLNYLDLLPIHDQLLKGSAPLKVSVIDWRKAFSRRIAEGEVKGHEDVQFWLSIGLSTLTAALFVVASITTGGAAAAFFIAGGAAAAAQPAMSWDKYLDLARASESSLSKEMALVSEEQVRGALTTAVLDSVFAFLDLYGAGKGISTALKAGRVPVIKEALLAGEKAAQAARTAIPEAIDVNAANARELVERSIGELGVSETRRRTGATFEELAELVTKDSPAHRAIKTYEERVSKLAGVPEVFKVEEMPAKLAALSSLTSEARDKLVLQSMKQFGPKRTVEMAGGWEKLSASLGKGTAAGEQLEAWRHSLYADLEKYVKQTLGGDLQRTGTPGFTSDLDMNVLGEVSSANRDKAMSYLAGRAGTSPDQVKKLLYCDMFTDPRRMHLYDLLSPAQRKQIADAREAFESGLVWNRRLYEAKEMGDVYLVASIRKQMKELSVAEVSYKPLTRPDIARLNLEIDSLHKQFLQTKDPELAKKIANYQAQINAAEGGGYFSSGTVRRLVSERPGEKLPALKPGQKPPPIPAERVGAVLDEMAKLDKEGTELFTQVLSLKVLGEADTPKLVQALKGIGKHGDRMSKIVREGFQETIPQLPKFDDMARAFEDLIKQARGGTLQRSVFEGKANVLIGKAQSALNEVEQSSVTLLKLLREHAEFGAMGESFARIKALTLLHVKLLRAKDALSKQIPTLLLQYIARYAQSNP